jgi:hypothetical protein
LITLEESLAIYGLLEEVNDYINNKLKRFLLNKVQKLKIKETRDQFLESNFYQNIMIERLIK